MSEIIFDLSNENCIYKGILFAEADNSQMNSLGMSPIPQKFASGIMAIIWVDENDIWHMKMRMKFPRSGNKQIFSWDYAKAVELGVTINETYILNDIYKFPMINKNWTPNPSGKAEDILEIIKKLDMVESMWIEDIDANTE